MLDDLVHNAYEPFAFMVKTMVPDGEGGTMTRYVEGTEFLATVSDPNSSIGKIADALTEVKNVQITTSRSVGLDVMDVVKRKSDGTSYRITSNGKDNQTPPTSSLDFKKCSAEVFVIPLYDGGEGS